MGTARVAVVVLTHNRRDEVLRTVNRLRELPGRPPVVAVDNASSDGTAEALRAVSGIDVVALPVNLGAAGRNVGARRVSSTYVAFADDDTWWEPASLVRAADLLDAHPRIAVVSGRVLVGPDEREDPACAVMAHSPLERAPGLPGVPLLGFLAGASMVRRRPFLEHGGFHPMLFLGGEEKLLAVDLVSAGWHCLYVPEVVVHHSPSPQRATDDHRRLLVRNALWFMWLRRPARRAIPLTLRLMAAATRDPLFRRAVLDALWHGGWTLTERRVVPPAVEEALRRLEAIDVPVSERAARHAWRPAA